MIRITDGMDPNDRVDVLHAKLWKKLRSRKDDIERAIAHAREFAEGTSFEKTNLGQMLLMLAWTSEGVLHELSLQSMEGESDGQRI